MFIGLIFSLARFCFDLLVFVLGLSGLFRVTFAYVRVILDVDGLCLLCWCWVFGVCDLFGSGVWVTLFGCVFGGCYYALYLLFGV